MLRRPAPSQRDNCPGSKGVAAMRDSHVDTSPGTGRPLGYRARRTARPSGWVGWVIFACVVMITLGLFHIIDGLVAIFEKGYYLVTGSHLMVHVDYAAWGWVHLVIGVVFVLTGFGVLAGMIWARVIGIAMAVISALVNLAFLAAYPLWGVILIALDIVVIYALAMHGREMKAI
jgi:hypothetical protein